MTRPAEHDDQEADRPLPDDWLDYGPEDPLDCERWLNPCAGCGQIPAMSFERAAHVVRCACGAVATAGKLPFQAVINWNKSPLSRHPSYQDLPFFYLQGLGIEEAREKLVRLREHLEIRKRVSEERQRRRQGIGHRYLQRLKAYLAWAIYGLGLVKEAELTAEQSRQAAADESRPDPVAPRDSGSATPGTLETTPCPIPPQPAPSATSEAASPTRAWWQFWR